MNFDMTAEQRQYYDSVVDFAKGSLNSLYEKGETDLSVSRAGWNACAEMGIMSSLVPESYGGSGLGALDSALLIEALGYGCKDSGLVFSIAAHMYACIVPLIQFGSDDLKSRYLPKLGSGECIATHSISEGTAGSDAFAMKTKATEQGDAYVLNGTKSYASNAPVADTFIIHAVTCPEAGFMGISAFVADKGTQGLAVSKPYEKIGLSSAPLGDIFLDNCIVDASQQIGSEGQGGIIFTHSMNWERACLFALYIGVMKRQLDEVSAYCRERKQFGKSIKDFQAVSHQIADMHVRIEAASLLVYKAAWMLDKHPEQGASIHSSVAKLFTSEAAVQISLDAMELFGGLGVMTEGNMESYLRNAAPGRTFSGTSNIQRNTIFKALNI